MMPTITAVRGMLRTDALRMTRDKFLMGVTAYILFVFLVMRVLIPAITADLASGEEFDLVPYHPLIVSYFSVQIAPFIPGLVCGFQLMECREEGVVKALMVSPGSLSGYLAVVGIAMFATAFVLTLFADVIIGMELLRWPALFAIALAAAPAGPIFALLIASFANNKVQAFVWMKIFGLGPALVLGAWFLPEPAQWLAAIYPPYCASKAYWVAVTGGTWLPWIFAGLAGSAIWLEILRRLFLKAARR